MKDTYFCGCLVELDECYRIRLDLHEIFRFQTVILHHIQNFVCDLVGERHENWLSSRIKDYLSTKDKYLWVWLVELNESNATSSERIYPVFKELSSTIAKIWCSVYVDERNEDRSFFEYKRLFLSKRFMFLWLTCRIKRMRLGLNKYLEFSKNFHRI